MLDENQVRVTGSIVLGLIWTLLVSTLLFALSGCGGGDGAPGEGRVKVSITDAPLDDASSVVVQFSGVAFKREGEAAEIVRNLSPSMRQLDLLAYQEGRAALLLDNVTLPAGRYEWIRLIVDNEPSVRDSYIELTNGQECELRVPSGAESGLKLNRGFTLPEDGSAALTIDFDLRKSVHAPPGQRGSTPDCTQAYLLRPTLRVVDDANVGAIAGTVDSALVPDDCLPKVYVYSGSGIAPDDIEETTVSGDVDPLLVANVAIQNGDTDYRYRAAFLPPGSYTVAFTCSDDDPTDDDALTFFAPKSVTVQANLIAAADFAPAAAP
ncbi:DUF4382 domain-containing protein [Steroidobacter flavus]|uniref:DUF4382 domain-containing protein n=1 Tax=Steroidobacter flavus TaxID=1842136 RepID=A0ABV8T2Q2_9GAMM